MIETFKDFQDYIVRYLWKRADSQLIADLPNLVKMGEDKLARDLDIELRRESARLFVEVDEVDLPSDYYMMESVVDTSGRLGEFRSLPVGQLRARRQSALDWQPFYALKNKRILFIGPTSISNVTVSVSPPQSPQEGDIWVRDDGTNRRYTWIVDPTSSQWVETDAPSPTTNSRTITIDYYADIPRLAENDNSWLLQYGLDLYLYAVLIQTAPFLREDERIPVWTNGYNTALQKELENSAHKKADGAIMAGMNLPRQASTVSTRRRRPGTIYSR